MTGADHLLSSQFIKRIPCFCPSTATSVKLLLHPCKTVVAATRSSTDPSPVGKRKSRNPRQLITISPGDGKWDSKWNCDYQFSLRDLSLEDLVNDEQMDTLVSINLCIHKHVSFGFSVGGRIHTTLDSNCSICSSPYRREVHSTFNACILPHRKSNRGGHLPIVGGDDPSVIYVKPGSRVDIDSLVQDTIRLAISGNDDTCSKTCKESETTFHVIAETSGPTAASSSDKRWSKLLELKKKISNK